MTELSQSACVACHRDAPRVTPGERAAWLPQLPEWTVREVDGIERLERVYKFKNFSAALEFTVAVGKMADAEDHHPALLTEWGKTTVSWWTHKIGGLHKNDFVCAAKTDEMFAQSSGS